MWIAGLLVIAAAQPVAVSTPAPRTLNFSIRADPTVAKDVNRVLAEVALPAKTQVPATADPATALANRCGDLATPTIISVTPDRTGNSTSVVYQPCLVFRPHKDFVIEPGSTIAQLALASGLRVKSIETARVRKKGSSSWGRASAKSLTLGDRVRFSNVPAWTKIEVDASKVADRSALIRLIARELNCAGEDPEKCVQRRGIDIADDNAAARARPRVIRRQAALMASPMMAMSEPATTVMATQTASVAMAVDPPPEAVPPPPPPPAPAPAPAAGPVSPLTEEIRETAPIAADQWPYDRALVAAILSQDQSSARPVIIGVADAGLGKADGSPLPDWIFDRNAREEDPEPDGTDDDLNDFVDDIDGAGIARSAEVGASGDLGVCPAGEAVSALTGEARATADHGSIVSSIATGLDIHRQATLSLGLPRLVFFRLLDDLCRTPARLQVTEADFFSAIEYVYERAPTLVLSYTITGQLSDGFVPTVKNQLDNLDRLLIIPAGNVEAGPGDLDRDSRCPACLAKPSNGLTATRTLVVGTGLRDLTVAPFSNWGRTRVYLYAPGETSIAVDLLGHPANTYSAATSWSAPYAGLAAAIIQALGPLYMPVRDVRERLIGSSWPLLDPDGKTDPENSGILNLTAAAAVRHHAIEVVELNPTGTYERRTYVGQLENTLAELCPEGGLGAAHSLRLGSLSNGRREVVARGRTYDSHAEGFPIRTAQCTLPDQIRFTDLLRGNLTFDSNAITQILLPWR